MLIRERHQPMWNWPKRRLCSLLEDSGMQAGGLSVDIGDEILDACRFNDNDLAHTALASPGAGTDAKKGTISVWVKRGNLGIQTTIFSAGLTSNDGNYTQFFFSSADKLSFASRVTGTFEIDFTTAQVFRDVSAYYHLVVAYDTTQAAEADGMKIYINGNLIANADFTTSTYTQNSDIWYQRSTSNTMRIGRLANSSNATYFDGYMADFIFVDGQQLTASSFGRFSSGTGEWVPKSYTGTYGTNGLRLDFAINTNYGNDVSGNNNDLTDSGLATNDQVSDTPTNKHCVMNIVDEDRVGTVANGNLDVSGGSEHQLGTFGMNSGKWIWKITVGTTESQSYGVENEAETESLYTASFTAADIIELRFDSDAGTLDRNLNSGGWTSVATGLTLGPYFPLIKGDCAVDFGQSGYTSSAIGYELLNAVNLSAPTIKDPRKYFNTTLHTGTGAELAITGVGFKPDLTWIKRRSAVAVEHALTDSVRGVTKELNSDSINDESTVAQGLKTFDSDGFTLGTNGSYNLSADTYVAWNWVKAAVPGFDIKIYTGTGVAHTETHSLGAIPDLIIVKPRVAATDTGWTVFHSKNTIAPETDYLVLNTTALTVDDANIPWNDVAPTSTVFTVGNALTNVNGDTYVAYLFADVEGFSKFGSYVGNGSTNGPFVWCGFRPAFVMVKNSNAVTDWVTWDSKRNTSNVVNHELNANATAAEDTNQPLVDFLSNGFKIRTVSGAVNGSGNTLVFAAFAESSFKYARAR